MTIKYAIYCYRCGKYIKMADEKSFSKLCDDCYNNKTGKEVKRNE